MGDVLSKFRLHFYEAPLHDSGYIGIKTSPCPKGRIEFRVKATSSSTAVLVSDCAFT